MVEWAVVDPFSENAVMVEWAVVDPFSEYADHVKTASAHQNQNQAVVVGRSCVVTAGAYDDHVTVLQRVSVA